MVAKKKTSRVTPKTVKKAKPAAKAKTVKKTAVKPKLDAKAKSPVKTAKVTNAELATLDRKTLAGKARKLKLELLAIRFNVQAPSLKDFRKKRQELATVLSQLDR
jgi:hypothetical protein